MRMYSTPAAAPAASNNTRKSQASRFTNSPIHQLTHLPTYQLANSRSVRRPVEIVLQDDRRGCGVEARLPPTPVALADCEPALRFATRQPLVFCRDSQRRAR